MKNKLSEELKNILREFESLSNSNQLYIISILLNHLDNGLINDGNYSTSDEAYESDKKVLESYQINLEDSMKLATNLLVIASVLDNKIINPNGIDIEPYINKKAIKEIENIIKNFYKLDYKNKIDFLIETIYIISEIKETEKIDFDFNGLIDELLTYSRYEFNENIYNNLEIQNY